jgi:hypothetical protein
MVFSLVVIVSVAERKANGGLAARRHACRAVRFT